jgi:hypothetical protein
MDESRLNIDAAREALRKHDSGGGERRGDDRDELVERVREMNERTEDAAGGDEPGPG